MSSYILRNSAVQLAQNAEQGDGVVSLTTAEWVSATFVDQILYEAVEKGLIINVTGASDTVHMMFHAVLGRYDRELQKEAKCVLKGLDDDST